MNRQLMHPRDLLVMIMARIYKFGMTTTSGGNLSIKDENGDVWITPSAIDKGSLTARDIVCVKADGSFEGIHKPSSEYPFHLAIYKERPDLKAVVHAHPPALVSFSIVRKIPDTKIIPQAHHVCGPVGYATYELPGSEALGKSIANIFSSGFNVVIMENHGTVVGGEDIFTAYQRFETLEFCARTIINANSIGKVKFLSEEQALMMKRNDNMLPELSNYTSGTYEKELRQEVVKVARRAYEQRLIISTYGTFSARLSKDDFLITPYGKDRYYLELEEIVLISNGKREPGKLPSRSVRLHHRIYQEHPDINAIISAQSPNATAYCVTGKKMDTRTIPESYILLRDIPLIPYGDQFQEGREISQQVSKVAPILLLENDSMLVTGGSLLETFDRLEVAEFSAGSLTQSYHLGDLVPINEKEISDLKSKFNLEG